MRSFLRGHTSGDFTHGRQERQRTVGAGHCLIGDACGSRCSQQFCLFRVRGKMQIGKQGLMRTQHFAFLMLRLFDFHDHLCPVENLRSGVDYFSTG